MYGSINQSISLSERAADNARELQMEELNVLFSYEVHLTSVNGLRGHLHTFYFSFYGTD